MSIDRWMDKEDVVYTYSRILLSHKKEWNIAICNNMDGPRDYHTRWSKSDRERQIFHLYVESKKIQMNLFTKQKQTCRHRKQNSGYQRGKAGGWDKLGIWD